MPRVNTATKSGRATKYPYICTACGKAIEPGQKYYYWQQFRSPERRRHVACGYPRQSELSSSKTAPLLDAVDDAQKEIDAWAPSLEWGGEAWEPVDASELVDILEGMAGEAEGVADEYEEGADNMPENLQYGSQAEAMRDVAERLREWADHLREFNDDEPDLPFAPEGMEEGAEGWEDFKQIAQEALDEWAEGKRQEATELLSEDVPEYEG